MSGGPNPYFDPGPFGEVSIDGVLIFSTLIEIDGASKPEDWSKQKGTHTSGETAVWKGTKLAEAIKLKFRAHNFDEYDAQSALLAQVRPKLGDKPPTLGIVNAVINDFGGIENIVLKTPAFPKWIEKSGCWEFDWEFHEDSPSKPANTGVADPANPDPTKGAAKSKNEDTEEAGAEAKGEAKSQ